MKARTRSALTLGAVLTIAAVPLLGSSCQPVIHQVTLNVGTMSIPPQTPAGEEAGGFRLTAGPKGRTLIVTITSQADLIGDGGVESIQPEFCILDVGGRMDISFVADGAGWIGQVPTPSAFSNGMKAEGALACQIKGQYKTDSFTVFVG